MKKLKHSNFIPVAEYSEIYFGDDAPFLSVRNKIQRNKLHVYFILITALLILNLFFLFARFDKLSANGIIFHVIN